MSWRGWIIDDKRYLRESNCPKLVNGSTVTTAGRVGLTLSGDAVWLFLVLLVSNCNFWHVLSKLRRRGCGKSTLGKTLPNHTQTKLAFKFSFECAHRHKT